MDEPHSPTGKDTPAHLVAQAERQLAALGAAIDQVIVDLESGQSVSGSDLRATVMSLRKALEAVFSERARLETLERNAGQRSGELDLDAARAEIERRLDRLRAAFATAGLSGGAQ
ncbi:hypothetical protein [Pararhodobacter sp.]